MPQVYSYYDHVLKQIRLRKAQRTAVKSRRKAALAGRDYTPSTRTAKLLPKDRPYVAVDGEGGGVNKHGQQLYKLLRAGNSLLFNDNKPLTTVQCLEFLLSLPKGPIYVGFKFCDYDATMVLRDIPPEYLSKMFAGPFQYTKWRNYGIDYLPGMHLKICRVDPVENKFIEGSGIWIQEVFGLFQSSFVKAIQAWGIGDAALIAEMETMKKDREKFVDMTPQIINYNATECRWLAELMTKFRDACRDCGIEPRGNDWSGAGKLAAQLLRKHRVMKAKRYREIVPQEVQTAAQHAYYGGRAELFRPGPAESAYYADINSAYPAAMLSLPCLEHGAWQKIEPGDEAWLTEDQLFLADVSFTHPAGTLVAGLPFRLSNGFLRWPLKGRGTYWSVELFAAQKHVGARFKIRDKGGWLFVPGCDHAPFSFLRSTYEERLRLQIPHEGEDPARAKQRGVPLKLSINSCYGKLAQRIGSPPWQNHVWAGLTTAQTRAWILGAVASVRQDQIISIATDALFSSVPLTMPSDATLGGWECVEAGAMFFALPGIYWASEAAAGRLVKTRGMTRDRMAEQTAVLESDYVRFLDQLREGTAFGLRLAEKNGYPRIEFPVPGFVSLRQAWHAGMPALAGHWTEGTEANRKLNMDWSRKRAVPVTIDGNTIQTAPHVGNANAMSASWAPMIADAGRTPSQHQQDQWHVDAQPDFEDNPLLPLGVIE